MPSIIIKLGTENAAHVAEAIQNQINLTCVEYFAARSNIVKQEQLALKDLLLRDALNTINEALGVENDEPST